MHPSSKHLSFRSQNKKKIKIWRFLLQKYMQFLWFVVIFLMFFRRFFRTISCSISTSSGPMMTKLMLLLIAMGTRSNISLAIIWPTTSRDKTTWMPFDTFVIHIGMICGLLGRDICHLRGVIFWNVRGSISRCSGPMVIKLILLLILI